VRAFGHEPAAFLEGRLTWRDVVHPDDRPRIDAVLQQVLSARAPGAPSELEHRVVCPDGTTRRVRGVWLPVFDVTGTVVAVDSLVVDLGAGEADPTSRQARLDHILEASHVGVFDFDFSRGTTLMTPAMQAWFGGDHLDLSSWVEHVHPDDAHRVREMLRQQAEHENDAVTAELRVRPDPSTPWRWVHVRSQVVERAADRAPLRSVGVVRDVTAEHETRQLRETLEHELREAQKARLLAQLSGGVAHDLNNVLQVVQFACRGLESEGLTDDGRLDLSRALEALERAARLTDQLLAVGRRQELQVGLLDVTDVLDRCARQHGLRYEPPVGPLPVRADRAQLEACLDHLVRNALDAQPRSGHIAVHAASVVLNDEQVRLHSCASPGPWLRLDVVDDGEGMDEATVARACEPFFTTRPQGSHAGLGLAVVNGVVQQHGGFLTIESTPGAGTRVSLFLPAEAGATRPATSVVAPDRRGTASVRGARVLLADDDVAVRSVVERVLRSAGHHVVVATDGETAVERYLADPDAVDVCIFDVLMPRVDGVTATRLIRARHPLVPVLLCTGFMGHTTERVATTASQTRLLRKPFTAARLLATIDELVSGPPEAPPQGS
jgi:PAS domain S-box-containing protein